MIMSDDPSSLNSGKKINIACSEKQTNKENKTVVEKAFTRSVRFRTRGAYTERTVYTGIQKWLSELLIPLPHVDKASGYS